MEQRRSMVRSLGCAAYTLTVCLLIAFTSGCAAPQVTAPRQSAASASGVSRVPQANGKSKFIRPGLVVNVTVLVAGRKEIEETGKRVSDEGRLALPLLGDVDCADVTLAGLNARLALAYAKYFVKPQVVIEFADDEGREGLSPWGSVTVLGRVKKPGKITMPATRDLTVSGAIQAAGGFDTSAKDTAIRVTRPLSTGQSRTWEVNLRAVGARGQTEEDLVLQADDIVFVPEMVF